VTFIPRLSGYNNTAAQLKLASDQNSAPPPVGRQPAFCNASLASYNWDYGPGLFWTQSQCSGSLRLTEFSSASPALVSVGTNFLQTTYSRTCLFGGGGSNFTLPDPEVGFGASGNVTGVSFAFPSNCSTSMLSYSNVYLYAVEGIMLSLQPTFRTSWGKSGAFDTLQLTGGDGKPLSGYGPSYNGSISLSLADALRAAGLTLDGKNLNSAAGGKGLSNASSAGAAAGRNGNSESAWPALRTTGVVLLANVRVSNYKLLNPVNYNVTGVVTFSAVSAGQWNSNPVQTQYIGGEAGQTYDSAWLSRQTKPPLT